MATKKTQKNLPDMMNNVMIIQRGFYLFLAYVSLGIAVIGILLPGLPSTEFVLLSAWAAAKSSPRLSRWLHQNKVTGTMLQNWNNGLCIERKTKVVISAMMLLALLVLWLHAAPMALKAIATLGMLVGNIIVWRRPEPLKNRPLNNSSHPHSASWKP